MFDLQAQITFFNELEQLKTITRQNKTLDGRQENSAEHSWQLALLAPILKNYFPEQVDMEKVILMLLVHDLGEVHTGDTCAFDEAGKESSYKREEVSLLRTLQYLPTDQSELYRSYWQEFEKGSSPEARYARVLDGLVPVLNHLLTGSEDDNPTGLTKSAVLAKKSFIQEEAPTLWDWLVQAVDTSVDKGLYLDR